MVLFFLKANHTPSGNKNDDLNAGRQTSLSCLYSDLNVGGQTSLFFLLQIIKELVWKSIPTIGQL